MGDLTQFEAGFRVFRDSVQIATAPADVTIYDDSTAVAGFPYTYYIVTMNDCGDANPSNTDVGHRPQDPVPPEAVQLGGAVADMDSIHVSLTWTDLSMDETTQVVFQVDSTLTPVATIGPNVEAVTITVYNDGPVDRCYAVAAQNCGVSALSDSVCTGIIAVGGAPSVIPRASHSARYRRTPSTPRCAFSSTCRIDHRPRSAYSTSEDASCEHYETRSRHRVDTRCRGTERTTGDAQWRAACTSSR